MSRELINRITRKKDGIYISTHSSNDDAPYHSVKINSLTNIYNKEGPKGLDREIINMLYNYAELRGSHHSLDRYLYACNSEYARNVYKKYTDKINNYYETLDEIDKKSLWSGNKTDKAKEYDQYYIKNRNEMYSEIAKKCYEYDLINNIILKKNEGKSFCYYENIIDKILDVSDKYNVDFDDFCPFADFGSDDELDSFATYSFSEFYKEILEKDNIFVEDISTKEKSNGKYIITINNNHIFETNTWEKLYDVFNIVESMINVIKENEDKIEYDR